MNKLILLLVLLNNSLSLFAAQPVSTTILVKAVISREKGSIHGFKKIGQITASMSLNGKNLFVKEVHAVNETTGEQRFIETRDKFLNDEKYYAELHPYYSQLVTSINTAASDVLKYVDSATFFYEYHPQKGMRLLGSEGLACTSPRAKD